jgi:hypothetical protein
MKRRKFVTAVPTAALLTTGLSLRLIDAEAAPAAPSDGNAGGSTPQQSKGFKVQSSAFDDPGAYDHVHWYRCRPQVA